MSEEKGIIRRILMRAITVPKEELEVTEIVSSQSLSDTIDVILGLKESEVKIVKLSDEAQLKSGTYIPERKAYLFTPLNQIASALGLDIKVEFYDVGGIPIYFIREPEVTELTKRIYIYLKSRIGETGLAGGLDLVSFARDVFEDLGIDSRVAFAEKDVKAAVYYIWRDLLGYGPLEIPMEDPNVEEVSWFSFDGPVLVVDKEVAGKYPNSEFVFTNVFIPRYYDDVKKKFFMTQIVRSITSKARAGLTTARPIAEARIPDPSGRGFHRLAAHLDITSRSPGITIRKFPQVKYSITYLIRNNTLSPLEAAYLIYQLIKRGFILIVGGMASGKSLAKDELVLAKINREISLLTFERLWDTLARYSKPSVLGEMEVLDLSNIDVEVLTLTENGVAWKKPKYLIRHRVCEKLVKIKTKTGRELVVTRDHSLLAWKVGGGRGRFDIVIEAVKPTEIAPKQAYLPYLRRLPLPDNSSSKTTSWKSPEAGYVLGFLVAEGSVKYGVSFYQAPGNVASHALAMLEKSGIRFSKSMYKRKNSGREYIVVRIREPHASLIKKLNIGENAHSKRVPDIFWNMSEEWRAAFLAGVIDGDGSVHAGKYIIEIATASRELAYGLLYAFASVGVHAYIREKRVKKYPDRVYYRVFVPIGINRDGLAKIARYLSEEKRKLIEEAVAKSSNHHSETDIVPAEIAYAIGTQLKRLEHGHDERLSFELRSYSYKSENPSYYRVEQLLGEKLYDFIPRGVGFDRVESIEEVDYDGYVYDIEVPETENFEANGVFVHNTTLLQALISSLPTSYKVVTIEDTPELSTPAQNWHPLYVRRAPRESELEDVDFSRLVIHSLRHRGTIVTLGEVRGAEMADLIQAAASVSRDTPVLIKVGDEVKLTRIGDVVDKIYEEAGNPPDWTPVEPREKIEVLTLDESGKAVFRPARWALRHYHRGKLYRIWYRDASDPSISGHVDVTGNHSIFVKRGGVVAVRGDSVKVGDVLIVLRSWHDDNPREALVYKIEQVDYDGYVYDFSVPGTEAFFGGTVPVLLHNSGHGAICLRPGARVVARINGIVRIMRIEEVYSEFEKGVPIEVLSYDLKTRELVWKKVANAFHVKTSKWLKIYTASGRVLEATPDHRLPVIDESGRLAVKQAGEVRVGDRLVIAPALPRARDVKKYVIVSGKYIELDQALGRLYGLFLAKGRVYSKRLTIPKNQADAEVIDVLKKVAKVRVGRTRVSASYSATKLIKVIEDAVLEQPLALPANFIKGVYDAIKMSGVSEVRAPSEDLAYALHYALRTIGVDSLVRGEVLRILGELSGPAEDTVVKIERINSSAPEDAYDIEVEDTHTFVTESSVVSMNCTFHAHDPESVLARITSPPINAAPESLLLITSIVHIAYTKTFVGGRPRPVRRVMRIFEIKDVHGRRVDSETIFSWSPMTDVHEPFPDLSNLEDVAKTLKYLWDASRTIKILGSNTYGQDEPYRALVDIYTLAYFLNDLAKREVLDIGQVLLRLTAFYLRMDEISNKLYSRYFKDLFVKYGVISKQ